MSDDPTIDQLLTLIVDTRNQLLRLNGELVTKGMNNEKNFPAFYADYGRITDEIEEALNTILPNWRDYDYD